MKKTIKKHVAEIRRKVDAREARVGVIGMGYVGLPLAVEFAEAGFRVTGVDVDKGKVQAMNRGDSHIEDIPDERLAPLVKRRLLRTQVGYKGCADLDAIFICVPTPLRKTRDPDISYIVSSVNEIARELRPGQLIVLESTTYPGTTEEVVRPKLEAAGLVAGRDFFLAFSPERVDPGNTRFQTRNTPKVVGGTSPACSEVAAMYYGTAIDTVHAVSSTQAAEMIKLLENTFRAVNIGLVNEIALMCEKLELDVWEVIDGAATKPFGFMRFYPGPGIGGHCIPLDPHYLSWKLRTLNYQARFIELASEINGAMPAVVIRRATTMLNDKSKAVKGSKILVLGAAYKRDTGDVRESPALDILKLLHERGAKMTVHDPYNKQVRVEQDLVLTVPPLTENRLKNSDLVIIVTDHSEYDYEFIVKHAPMVLDTRNATAGLRRGRSKIQKL